MKRLNIIITIVLLGASQALFGAKPKYVFYFIGDGMGIYHQHITEIYNREIGAEPLSFPQFPIRGFVNTFAVDNYWTDSAAAGTALASGQKVQVGHVGISADGKSTQPLTIFAKQAGMGAGLVSSDGVTQATPAAFYAHAVSRNDYMTINRDLIDSKLDFVAGASFSHRKKDSLHREDWINEARKAGIAVYCGKAEYKGGNKSRVIYLSEKDTDAISYLPDIKPEETHLEDFVRAAVNHLYANYRQKGFFIMVENGLVDHAAHSRDLGTVVAEVNNLSSMVNVALEFMARHPNETLIIVTADHETGGMSLIRDKSALDAKWIQYQKCSVGGLTAKIGELRKETGNRVTWFQVKDLLREQLGLWDSVPLSPKQEKTLTLLYKEAFLDNPGKSENMVKDWHSSNSKLAAYAVDCMAAAVGVTWASGNHSSAPVPYFVKGAGQEAFQTCTSNVDIPKTLAKLLWGKSLPVLLPQSDK